MNSLDRVTAIMLDPGHDFADLHYRTTYSSFDQRRQGRLDWLSATDFDRMCELTAQWLEGKSAFIPGSYADGADAETLLIQSQVARLNRLGFLTTFSQPALSRPAEPGSDGCEQRAAVHGLVSPAQAEKISKCRFPSQLLVQIYRPGVRRGQRVAVSRKLNKSEYTWSGNCDFEYQYHCFRPHLSAQGMAVIEQAYCLDAIDLVWQRKSLLWDALTGAMIAS